MGFYTCGVFYETHSKLFINSCLFFLKILEKEIVQDVARDCLQKLLYTQSLD